MIEFKDVSFSRGGLRVFSGLSFTLSSSAIDAAANGIIGLETAVPLALALVRDNIIDAARFVELLAVHPAVILGLDAGTLNPGLPADITIIDPEQEFLYTEDQVVSKSRNTPFLGWRMQGRAVLTMVGGEVRHSLLT